MIVNEPVVVKFDPKVVLPPELPRVTAEVIEQSFVVTVITDPLFGKANVVQLNATVVGVDTVRFPLTLKVVFENTTLPPELLIVTAEPAIGVNVVPANVSVFPVVTGFVMVIAADTAAASVTVNPVVADPDVELNVTASTVVGADAPTVAAVIP